MTTKYKAARIAAAKFSSDAQSAAGLYAELTEQKFDDWHNSLEELKREIPAYRWPTFDSIAEIMIFFNPSCDGMTADIIGVNSTPAMQKAAQRGDDETYSELYQSQIEIIKTRREAAKGAEAEAHLEHGKRTFENTGGDSKKRNSALARSLGLSTGKKPKEINELQIYKDYFDLVRKEGLCRYDALEIIMEKYNLPTTTATQQHLSLKMKSIRLAAKKQVTKNDAGETVSTFARDTILNYLKGFILDGWALEKIEDPEVTYAKVKSLTEESLPF